jgi:hypothetical protein
MKKLYEEDDIQKIADAIRTKTGKSDKMKVGEMSGEVGRISTGYSLEKIAMKELTGEITVLSEQLKAYTFCLFSDLTSIIAPNATLIGALCFSNDTALERCDLSSKCSFNDRCFFNCTSLNLILRSAEQCPLSSTAIFQSSAIAKGTGHIYVPKELADSYKSAANWSVYADQFRALEDYTVDGTITGELDESKI